MKDFAYQIKGGPYPRKTYNRVLSQKDPRDFFVNGVHRLNGIFIAHGEGIRNDYQASSFNIIDLFPTVLHCLGLKVPEAIDGHFIADIFVEGRLTQNPLEYVDYNIYRYSGQQSAQITYEQEEESKEIEKALKGLGYID